MLHHDNWKCASTQKFLEGREWDLPLEIVFNPKFVGCPESSLI